MGKTATMSLSQKSGFTNGPDRGLFVLRLNADGSFDSSFNNGGTSPLQFSTGTNVDLVNALAVQADGQIVVGGCANAGSGSNDWGMARLNGGDTRQYAQHDANYNITGLADNNGNVVKRFVYSAYGVQTVLTGAWVVSGASNSVYGFQGGRFDMATGMNHFGARDYRSSMGVWMRRDPAGYVDGLSSYQFVRSDPIAATDPSGLEQVDSSGDAILHYLYDGGAPATLGPTLIAEMKNLPFFFDQIEALERMAFANLPKRPGSPRRTITYRTPFSQAALFEFSRDRNSLGGFLDLLDIGGLWGNITTRITVWSGGHAGDTCWMNHGDIQNSVVFKKLYTFNNWRNALFYYAFKPIGGTSYRLSGNWADERDVIQYVQNGVPKRTWWGDEKGSAVAGPFDLANPGN